VETITRKSLLYKSGLGFYCINPVLGCRHGCRYPCHACMMALSYGRVSSYDDWCRPRLVANAAYLLKKELSRMKVKPDCIHLCLSTDPFMYQCPEVIKLSLELISLINSHDIRCSILTKGELPAELADTGRFAADNVYGISLGSINEEFRKKWEPGTASYADRIHALRVLHEKGLITLVHMEPYPTPNIVEQDIGDILREVAFADQLFFGRWNYNNRVKQYPRYLSFYAAQAELVERFCAEHGINDGVNA